MSDKPLPPPPPPQEFYFKDPLYTKYAYNETTLDAVWELKSFAGPVDVYCPWCGKESVFRGVPNNAPASQLRRVILENSFTAKFTCARAVKHQLQFTFLPGDGVVQKIGQYPSLADLAAGNLKKYRKVLGKDRHFEFKRAIGLAAHGVGIGSFVYLRRIFESLVSEAAKLAAHEPSWDEEAFSVSRMHEKIDLVRNHLPDFLVQNRSLYGILSKGIHELTEDECQRHFQVVRVGIEMILDAKLEDIQRKEKLAQAQKEIQALGSSLMKKP